MNRFLLAAALLLLISAPVAAQQLPMPSDAHKEGFRAQFQREGAVTSDVFLSAPERIAANGFMASYLNAPRGSAAEREAWNGLARYLLLRQQRQGNVEAGVRAEMAATQRWRDERAERRRINRARGIEQFNRVCSAHQRSDLRWTHAETTEALRLLDEAIVLGVDDQVTAEEVPHNCRASLHEENDLNVHHDRDAILQIRDPGAEVREYSRQRAADDAEWRRRNGFPPRAD